MKYEAINPISREVAEAAANHADSEVLARAILAVAVHADDLEWAESYCTRFARHSDPSVRGSALIGFAHLARRFRKLDADQVQPILKAGLRDADPWVRGQVESAVDDVEFLLGWRVRVE